MSIIEYTARRSLYADHIAGTRYEIEVDIAIDSTQREIDEVKFIERSPGGGMEQGLERIDEYVPIQIILVGGTKLMQLREFMDSTESGETFRVYVCEDADSPRQHPIIIKRIDDGHTEMAFIRKGTRQDDSFSVSIRGLVSSQTIGGEISDTDAGDIYDETNDTGGGGGGGMGPPLSALEVSLYAHDIFNTGMTGTGSQEAGVSFCFSTVDGDSVTFGNILLRGRYAGSFIDPRFDVDGVAHYNSLELTDEWWVGPGAPPETDYEVKMDLTETLATACFVGAAEGTWGSFIDLASTTPRFSVGCFFFNSSGNWTGQATMTIRRKADSVVMGSVVYDIELDCT